jgi:hypothetical protein
VVLFALGLLERVADMSDEIERFHAIVDNEDGGRLGEVIFSKSTLARLEGPSKSQIAQERLGADLDTLGDSMMWVERPAPVVPKLRKTKRRL